MCTIIEKLTLLFLTVLMTHYILQHVILWFSSQRLCLIYSGKSSLFIFIRLLDSANMYQVDFYVPASVYHENFPVPEITALNQLFPSLLLTIAQIKYIRAPLRVQSQDASCSRCKKLLQPQNTFHLSSFSSTGVSFSLPPPSPTSGSKTRGDLPRFIVKAREVNLWKQKIKLDSSYSMVLPKTVKQWNNSISPALSLSSIPETMLRARYAEIKGEAAA